MATMLTSKSFPWKVTNATSAESPSASSFSFLNMDQIHCKNVTCAPAFYVLYIPNLNAAPCMCVGFGYCASLYLIEGESCLRSPLHYGSVEGFLNSLAKVFEEKYTCICKINITFSSF